ncbi:MAG: DotD/TraH family lipoprotein [Plesiomonas shigelloides]|uniref:DotD/TraH family lipoprotein n=1 Tax=Plesiomonas sp. ZOR0011 TaxID=1339230 RepID=UPI000647FD08|nr:DotD/TraH family lipoprotein [Plesiomonas sp. ZOR0011]
MTNKTLISILALAFLSGCQAQPTQKTNQLTPQEFNADCVSKTREQLYVANAINNVSPKQTSYFLSNADRLSVNWDGDAIELLAQLARQRGLNFAYTGVRLPLPVSVHDKNISFEGLLRQLKMQINWRATLIQNPTELRLYFSLPEKGGRLA